MNAIDNDNNGVKRELPLRYEVLQEICTMTSEQIQAKIDDLILEVCMMEAKKAALEEGEEFTEQMTLDVAKETAKICAETIQRRS